MNWWSIVEYMILYSYCPQKWETLFIHTNIMESNYPRGTAYNFGISYIDFIFKKWKPLFRHVEEKKKKNSKK